MKTVLLLFIAILFMSGLCLKAQSGSEKRTLKVINLSGSNYEMGFQHGQQLKSEIDQVIVKWKQNIANNFNGNADSILHEFFEYAHFMHAIQKYAPELLEEVKGIAAGSGQNFEDMLGLNLMDEYWVYLNNKQNGVESHHCTCVGVPASKTHPAYLAQNMDIEKYLDGYQVLMRISANGNRPEQLIFTFPGCLGLNGLNNNSIASCENTVLQLKASNEGLPVMFVVRRIIGSTNKDELLKFIQTVPHASGQNYMIGIGNAIFDFEASSNKVVRLFPETENGVVTHTNHPLLNDDAKPWYAEFDPKLNQKHEGNNSCIRLESAQHNMGKSPEISDQTIKAALRATDDPSNAVCRSLSNNGRSYTFGSTIMTLGENPSLQITSGPPNESEYKTFTFTEK